ncbi:hypothetical protein [Microbulbifer variabilis]|uniref:Lipoprotein n=1 Tax=Microbulbifer variabilis TaxID=266805 RepID=A0ABY4VG45_9GAMM|nr:hypothetical protein [Microbulbifer variabilis]USD23248.1 hypothetical protein MJO52_08950 [Microbulbifer variabilis]
MTKLAIFLWVISISFSCEGQVIDRESKYENLELSTCHKIGCLFRTTPADMAGSYLWVESFFPMRIDGVGKLNRIYVGQGVGDIEVLRVPIEGYISGSDKSQYISGFRVKKNSLKQVFMVVVYGAEDGHAKQFKIEGFQSLL